MLGCCCRSDMLGSARIRSHCNYMSVIHKHRKQPLTAEPCASEPRNVSRCVCVKSVI